MVKLTTPRHAGTGFVFANPASKDFLGIATAAHVIDHAHAWEQPIRIEHTESGKSILARPGDRAVWLDQGLDTAVLLVSKESLPDVPSKNLELTPVGKNLRVGFEVGWVGFPAVSPDHLCFFSGRLSYWIEPERAYLVDGVAINGVSGGPAFHCAADGTLVVIGVVSAYLANTATGATLPGLSLIRDVALLQEMTATLNNLEQAQSRETPAQDVQPRPQAKETPSPSEASPQADEG